MIDPEKALALRVTHDKEHRAEHNVPPAFCPLCQGEVEKLDSEFKETKKKILKGETIIIK